MEEIEKKGVKPDGYKATDEEVAQQEEMIERKGLNDVVVAENATTSSTCKESLQVGNSAKMREALEYLRDASREFHHLILNSKHNEICDKYKYPAVAKISDAIANAGAVLAEPPRNCDIGTAEEQEVRFKNYCWNHSSRDKNMECQCPIDTEGRAGCKLEWAQMPYESEVKK